jgi:phosphopantothenoylcysteine decarboxylase/phosphopantothenate--cysteine ligase
MFNAVKGEIESADIFIACAAVADFRPVKIMGKVKKREGITEIKLERNPDILKWVGGNYKNKIIIGFSLDDRVDIEYGRQKKEEKNCNIMIVNNVSNLGSDTKSFTVISDTGISEYLNLSLEKTAEAVLKECLKIL